MKGMTKKKKISLAIIIGIVVIAVVILIIVLNINNKKDASDENVGESGLIEEAHGPGEEASEKSLVFYNRDFLTTVYNRKISSIVADDIEKAVFSDEEMVFSGDNSPLESDREIFYDATIDVEDYASYNMYMSDFNVRISDGREYQVIVDTNDLEEYVIFIYTAISRIGSNKIWVFVHGIEDYEEDFINFVKEKFGKNTVDVIIGEDIF